MDEYNLRTRSEFSGFVFCDHISYLKNLSQNRFSEYFPGVKAGQMQCSAQNIINMVYEPL